MRDVISELAASRRAASIMVPVGVSAHLAESRTGDSLASVDVPASTRVVGFDVGTTNATLSAIGDDGMPIALATSANTSSTPSVVLFDDGSFHIGELALSRIQTNVANMVDRLTCRFEDYPPGFVLGGRKVPMQVLCAVIVAKLADLAKQRVGYFSNIVYTVPGCFGDVGRRAFEDVYGLASLEPLDSINASTSVAVYFSFLHGWLNPLRNAPPQTILVFRYGAGSFDATIYRVKDRQLKAIALAGDSRLGGCVWDDRLARNVAEQLEKAHRVRVVDDPASMLAIRQQCEAAKIALSAEHARLPVRIRLQKLSLEGSLSHSFLRKIGADLLQRAEDLTREALSDAGIGWNDLDHVLMAGGTSRMPIVREMVESWPTVREKCSWVDPEAAAMGAVLYGQILTAGSQPTLGFRLQEVCGRTIGLVMIDPQTKAKTATFAITKNASLPAMAKVALKTAERGQTSIPFEVFEQNSTSTKQVRRIGTGRVAGLPPGLPAGTPVALEFHLARNGILSLVTESIATGRRSSPEFDRPCEMTPDEHGRWRQWLENGLICGRFD
jgi:molecular chaperone DnaK